MSKTSPSVTFTHRLIRASAGTGKTFQLSNRFLGLLEQGVPGDQILATTFTRKAAGEILQRVLLRLAKAALEEQSRAELATSIGRTGLTRDRCLDLLRDCVRNLHRMRISTLDSFFAQIARSYSLELGLPPGWQIVDELDDGRLRSEAIAAVLRQHNTQDLLTLMHLLTKGQASRSVSELMRSTVNSLYSLFRETSADAWHRVPRQNPLSNSKLAAAITELQALELPTKRLITARAADVGRAFSGDWENFVGKGLAVKIVTDDPVFYRQPIPENVVALYRPLIQHAKAELIGRVALQTEGTYDLLKKFDGHYRRLQQEHAALRFNDITRGLADNLARARGEEPELGRIQRLAFRLDAHLNHLLLDEFQDTSLAQWQVVRPFAQWVSGGGKHRSFFCVGDVKQAIYGWRGGVAEIFDAVAEELDNIETLPLDVSYRSAQPVIDTVNQIFTNIASHPHLDREAAAVQRFSEQFKQHSTAQQHLAGYACLLTAPLAGEDQAQTDITLDCAAERIARIVQQAPGASVGVLVRKNQTVAELIYRLRQRNIPASEEGGNPLTDSAAVTVVLSLLRLADHPGDKVARFHLAQSPLAPAIEFPDGTDDTAARQLAHRVRRSLVGEGYGPVLYHWAKALAPSCNRRELSRLAQLVRLGYRYQDRATLRSTDFVNFVENQRVSDPAASDVRVMTVHQSKGLQFDVVVLPELDVRLAGRPDEFVIGRAGPTSPADFVCRYVSAELQPLLPSDMQQMFADASSRVVTESLCVLYVAITRAIHALHMIIAPPPKKQKTMGKTLARLLRVSLHDNEVAESAAALYEHGDREWFKHPGTEPAQQPVRVEPVAPTDMKPLEVRLAPAAGKRSRGLDRIAPSGLEGGSAIKLSDRFQLQDNTEALLRGTLIHAWLEQIEWLDDGRPDQSTLQRVLENVTSQEGGQLPAASQWMQQFNKMLDRPETARLLSRAGYQPPARAARTERAAGLVPAQDGRGDKPRGSLGSPVLLECLTELSTGPLRLQVSNERKFAVRDGDAVLAGSIDRLVLMYRDDRLLAADVIDFKTDDVPADDPDALAAKVDFYRPQVEAYRRAVSRMTRLAPERISCRLLFLASAIVVSV